MDEETKKIISDQLRSLPKVVQDSILTSGWEKKTHDLAKKYNLHIDQEGLLVNETFLVMLGIELAKDFNQNLVDNLGISKIIASQIEGDINEEILKPIRKDLQKLNEETEKKESAAVSATDLAKEVLGDTKKVESKTENTEDLDRDAILREIETPTATPVTPVSKPVASPVSKPIEVVKPVVPSKPVTTVSTTVEPMPSVSVMPTSPNMVDEKLKNIVMAAKKEVVVENKPAPLPTTEAPKRTDPYREPIA